VARRTITIRYLLLGAASGVLAGLSTLYPLGSLPAPTLFAQCFGLEISGRCEGIDAAFYLFPGLIFGVLFVVAQLWRGLFGARHVLAFALASGVGNAVATLLCIGLFSWLSLALNIDFLDLPPALGGAIAGAAGSTIVIGVMRFFRIETRPVAPIVIGTALGLLVPLVTRIRCCRQPGLLHRLAGRFRRLPSGIRGAGLSLAQAALHTPPVAAAQKHG
jgi:hypothetical protein